MEATRSPAAPEAEPSSEFQPWLPVLHYLHSPLPHTLLPTHSLEVSFSDPALTCRGTVSVTFCFSHLLLCPAPKAIFHTRLQEVIPQLSQNIHLSIHISKNLLVMDSEKAQYQLCNAYGALLLIAPGVRARGRSFLRWLKIKTGRAWRFR